MPLGVIVEEGDQFTARLAYAGVPGGAAAPVAIVPEVADARLPGVALHEPLGAFPVAAAGVVVIHYQQLPLAVGLLQDAVDRPGEELAALVGGQHDAHQGSAPGARTWIGGTHCSTLPVRSRRNARPARFSWPLPAAPGAPMSNRPSAAAMAAPNSMSASLSGGCRLVSRRGPESPVPIANT